MSQFDEFAQLGARGVVRPCRSGLRKPNDRGGAPTPVAPDSLLGNGAEIFAFPRPDSEPKKAAPFKLLFVCRTHAVLSPIAEGLAGVAYQRLDIAVQSAGLSPVNVDPRAVAVMQEIGIDISATRSTSVRDLDLSAFDIVVSLGVHKLGLQPRQISVRWDVPEYTRVTNTTAWSRLQELRATIDVRVQALGAILTATSRA